MPTFREDLLKEGIKNKFYLKDDDYVYQVKDIYYGRNSHTGVEEFIVEAIGFCLDGNTQKLSGAPTHHSLINCMNNKRLDNFITPPKTI